MAELALFAPLWRMACFSFNAVFLLPPLFHVEQMPIDPACVIYRLQAHLGFVCKRD